MTQAIWIEVEGVGRLPWQNQHSLLEALEDAGIDMNYSCRAGICAACKVNLLEGKVHWSTQPITTLHGKEILACSTKPLTDIRIAVPD